MMFWGNRACQRVGALAVAMSLAGGCHHSRPDVHYLGAASDSYYTDHATEIEYPTESYDLTPPEVTGTEPPHTVRDAETVPIRDMTLAEAVHLALTNSSVIRTGGSFLSPGNPLLANPNGVASVFDPAIQNSGVLFGGRGVEAALAAFDAQLNAAMIWNRNEAIANNPFFGGVPGSTFAAEGADFVAELQKTFAYGGSLTLSHDVNYQASNVNPANVLFRSAYSGNVGLQYRQPLLAGAGAEYTRIAGPIGQGFGGLTGVSQGVIIARINNDMALADFELDVQNLLKDVEDAYWNLYLSYRTYHTAVAARESSLSIWDYVNKRREAGSDSGVELSQAQDQLFATETATSNAWSNVFTNEVRLRRLLGLPANDGTMIRPVDEPITAELIPDWYSSLTQALTHRVELRKQKWNLKSLELQLRAARSLTRPRLDLVGGYQVNGFGDDLLQYNDDDVAGTAQGLNSFYETITQGNQTGWNVGVQMNMPLGFRSARAQVTNYELRLAKGQKILQEQEKEISLELAVAFQDVARNYNAAKNNMNRFLAAEENVRLLGFRKEGGTDEADIRLRAVVRQAEAEVAYYESLINYNKSLTTLQYYQGTILRHNSISLSEGAWAPEAYEDAAHHAKARAHAWTNDLLHHEPEAFSSPVPTTGVHFTTEGAAQGPVEYSPPVQTSPDTVPQPEATPQPQALPPEPQPAPAPPLPSAATPSEPLIQPQSWKAPAATPAWVSPVMYETEQSVPRSMPSVFVPEPAVESPPVIDKPAKAPPAAATIARPYSKSAATKQ